MKSIKGFFTSNKKRAIIIVVLVFALLTAGGFAIKNNNDQKTDSKDDNTQNETDTKKDDQPASGTTKDSQSNKNPSQSSPGSTAPVSFAISSLNVHNPEYSYNKDKLGNTVRACQVIADITATAPGTATYYWDTYHPEYFTPSNRGPDETVTFEGKGTKTVKLNTYTNNDDRRFTLYVISPNNISKATATQAWCKAD